MGFLHQINCASASGTASSREQRIKRARENSCPRELIDHVSGCSPHTSGFDNLNLSAAGFETKILGHLHPSNPHHSSPEHHCRRTRPLPLPRPAISSRLCTSNTVFPGDARFVSELWTSCSNTKALPTTSSRLERRQHLIVSTSNTG